MKIPKDLRKKLFPILFEEGTRFILIDLNGFTILQGFSVSKLFSLKFFIKGSLGAILKQ